MNASKKIFVRSPENFSREECIWFLDRNYDECLHTLGDNTITKAVSLGGQGVVFKLGAGKGGLLAEILKVEGTAGAVGAGRQQAQENAAGGAEIERLLREYIIDWFDLGRDIAPFYALLKKDKRLAYMAEEYKGLRLIGIVDLFEALCWSVIGQQINLQFAYKTKRRLVERYGDKIGYEGKNHYLFPTPDQLAAATMDELKVMQFSQNKARYLIGLGEVFAKGQLSKEQLIAIDGLEERRKALTDLKGVGIWTANYSLMKSLRDPTCIPHGDVGLLNALAGHAIIKERSEEKKIEKLFSKFPGWESYLVFYLWRSLAGPGRKAHAVNDIAKAS